MAEPLLFLEELPDEVTATIESRDRALAALGSASGGLEFVVQRLQGAPNFWSRAKVDHNLREVRGPGIEASAFDRASVMLYRFPALFYRTANSDCMPQGDGQSLSEGDRSGLRSLYPSEPDASEEVAEGKRSLLGELASRDAAPEAGLESMGPPPAGLSRALAPSVHCLKRQLGGRY
jgi:hypothetical protein